MLQFLSDGARSVVVHFYVQAHEYYEAFISHMWITAEGNCFLYITKLVEKLGSKHRVMIQEQKGLRASLAVLGVWIPDLLVSYRVTKPNLVCKALSTMIDYLYISYKGHKCFAMTSADLYSVIYHFISHCNFQNKNRLVVCYLADRNELRSRVIEWLQTEVVPGGWFSKGSNFSDVLLKYFQVFVSFFLSLFFPMCVCVCTCKLSL